MCPRLIYQCATTLRRRSSVFRFSLQVLGIGLPSPHLSHALCYSNRVLRAFRALRVQFIGVRESDTENTEDTAAPFCQHCPRIGASVEPVADDL